MLKKCPKCKRKLSLSNFNWKIRNVKLSVYCKECSRKYIKDHYKRNREYYLRKARRRNADIRKKGFNYLLKYLRRHPCVDCGESDILVLEFDHQDRAGKDRPVSRIIRDTNSLEKLKIEISKCDVRCANCHRRKTAKEGGSWKLKYAPVA